VPGLAPPRIGQGAQAQPLAAFSRHKYRPPPSPCPSFLHIFQVSRIGSLEHPWSLVGLVHSSSRSDRDPYTPYLHSFPTRPCRIRPFHDDLDTSWSWTSSVLSSLTLETRSGPSACLQNSSLLFLHSLEYSRLENAFSSSISLVSPLTTCSYRRRFLLGFGFGCLEDRRGYDEGTSAMDMAFPWPGPIEHMPHVPPQVPFYCAANVCSALNP